MVTAPITLKRGSPLWLPLPAVRWVALVSVLFGWFLLMAPTAVGGPGTYVMISGTSMEPGLHTGDLVIAREADRYGVGDTVAYKVPEGDPGAGQLVIHRIVGGSATEGWILQGDNRDDPDFWRPTNEDIVGKRWLLVPRAAQVILWFRTPLGMATLAGLAAFSVVIQDEEEENDELVDGEGSTGPAPGPSAIELPQGYEFVPGYEPAPA